MIKMEGKWLKSISIYDQSAIKKPNLWGRTYLYSPYKGVLPRAPFPSVLEFNSRNGNNPGVQHAVHNGHPDNSIHLVNLR